MKQRNTDTGKADYFVSCDNCGIESVSSENSQEEANAMAEGFGYALDTKDGDLCEDCVWEIGEESAIQLAEDKEYHDSIRIQGIR